MKPLRLPSYAPVRPPRARSFMSVSGLLLGASLCAQTVTPAPATSTSPGADNSVVELSPFTVDASRDVGYLANNTLAGSRLNTSLKDTAASISVLTEEFLADIGALDMTDASAYANNLQLDQDDTTPSMNGNSLTEFYHNYRPRGTTSSGTSRPTRTTSSGSTTRAVRTRFSTASAAPAAC